MNASWLLWLRCPFCGGGLSSSGIDQAMHAPGYDVLSCWCSRYPVVAGIPIIKRSPDGTLENLIALIETGQYLQALLTLIAPASPALAPAWMQSLPSIREIRWLKHLAHQRALRGWEEQAAALLTDHDGQVTARALFNLYFNHKETYNYFYFRFGQPRHLITLSFASVIYQPKKPILDLACGCGHITWTLVQRAKGQPVIGVDNSFFGLYIAKHWIAPEAEYVCCTADSSLPFSNGAFSVAFCSDAFHYFINKATIIRELDRLTQHDGLMILVWIHNALLRRPYDGQPLPPEGYQALAADIPHRLVVDSDVLARYRHKLGPSLARTADMKHLVQAPLLSLVASHRQGIFQDYGPFEDWPHAWGCLGINPLFITEKRDESGNVYLRRMFPSAFYEEEHAECKDYLPETVKVPSDLWANLSDGKRGPEVERLIEQCVVMGIPKRYR
jgi:SAM-dependent methyltransferase